MCGLRLERDAELKTGGKAGLRAGGKAELKTGGKARLKTGGKARLRAGGKAGLRTGGKARWGASEEGAEAGSALYGTRVREVKRATTQLALSTTLHRAFPPKTDNPKGYATRFSTALQRSPSKNRRSQKNLNTIQHCSTALSLQRSTIPKGMQHDSGQICSTRPQKLSPNRAKETRKPSKDDCLVCRLCCKAD